MTANNGFFSISRVERHEPLFRLICKGSPLMYLCQIVDCNTGVCPTSIQGIERSCRMTRQEVRTFLEKSKRQDLLSVDTVAKAVKGLRGFHKISTIKLNMEHPLLKYLPKERTYEGLSEEDHSDLMAFEYPSEFIKDWEIYCGTSRDKVGSKKYAFKSWDKSVKKWGREKVMRGTVNYVAECEGNGTWKKNGATWWYYKEARFMESKYQKTDACVLALWEFKNSPVLGNLLSGGCLIEIKGDDFMGEALIKLKGSDSTIGQTLDRLGDKKFERSFLTAYKEARTATSNPRKEIYSQYGNRILWEINTRA